MSKIVVRIGMTKVKQASYSLSSSGAPFISSTLSVPSSLYVLNARTKKKAVVAKAITIAVKINAWG